METKTSFLPIFNKRRNILVKKLSSILVYSNKFGIITQRINPSLRRSLKKYYSFGGYASLPLGEGTFGKRRGEFVFDFFKKALGEQGLRFKGSSFLEIGSSYGYLLYLIKKEGAKNVLGIEPGEEGFFGSQKYKVKTIKDFFPSKQLDGKYDCVLSHCVLEHLENPKKVVREMWKSLKEKGVIFLAVPDCEEKMKIGDVSIISYQHLNYFTQGSLEQTLIAAGFSNIKVVKTGSVSMLCASAKKLPGQKKQSKSRNSQKDKEFLELFKKRLSKNLKNLQEKIKYLEKHGKSIGLYGDCANLKASIKFTKEPRMFDSDKAKIGKEVSGITFEGPIQLLQKPVDALIITPVDYDSEIRTNLKNMGLNDKITEIISVKEIYEKNSGLKYISSGSTSR